MRTKIDPRLRRVLIFGRVKPETAQFLEELNEPNSGRAIDRLVATAQDLKQSLNSLKTSQVPK